MIGPAIAFAVLGAALGSFLNLCIDRLPRGESLVRPPSRCDRCGTRLGWRDLVPIVSYLALRGRCRTCGGRVPVRALVVEALAAGLLGYVGYSAGDGLAAIPLATYLMVFLLLTFIDLEQGILPDKVVYPAAMAAVGLSTLLPDVGLERALLGGLVGFGALLAVYLAARGGMGGGDVKLAALVGLAVGVRLVGPALFLAAVAGGAAGVWLLATRRKGKKDFVPFGPFLASGGVVALLWGPALVNAWANAMRGGVL